MSTPEEITVEGVLETLNALDESEKQAVKDAADKATVAAVEAVRKLAEEEAKSRKPEPKKVEEPRQDDATRMAWSLADDYVTDTCPDLDAETLEIVRSAAGNDPVAFKTKAKAMQKKLSDMKTPANDEERKKRDLAAKIFDGGGGGGSSTVTKTTEPTAEEKIKSSVEKGDSRGILQNVAKNINDKKMFERGVQIIVD